MVLLFGVVGLRICEISYRVDEMGRIKLVIFDIDGTLYESREYEVELGRTIVNLIGEMLGISAEEARRLLESEKKTLLTVSSSITRLGLDRRQFYSLLAERIEPSSFIAPDPLIVEEIRSLRASGVKVAAHTNSGTLLASKVLNALGLKTEDFDIVMTSDEAEPKPAPDGYIRITERAGVSPSEAVYVGDRPLVELRTAKTLGMTTIMVGQRRSTWADYSVSTIHEALKLINRLIVEDA